MDTHLCKLKKLLLSGWLLKFCAVRTARSLRIVRLLCQEHITLISWSHRCTVTTNQRLFYLLKAPDCFLQFVHGIDVLIWPCSEGQHTSELLHTMSGVKISVYFKAHTLLLRTHFSNDVSAFSVL